MKLVKIKMQWLMAGAFGCGMLAAQMIVVDSGQGAALVQEVQEVQEIQNEAVIGLSISRSQDGDQPATSGMLMMSSGEDGSIISSFAVAEMGDGPMFFNAGGGSFSLGGSAGFPFVDPNNWGNLLNIPEIRAELDIMDAQFEEITKARQELEKTVRQHTEQMMSGGFDPSKAKQMAEEIRSRRESIEGQIREQLLPRQVQRLKEVALRIQMQQTGPVGLLGRPDVMEALDLDQKQVDSLKEKAQQLDQELKKRMEELKKKAEAELIGQLKPEQQKKLEELLGKDFEYKAPQPRVRRSQPGGNRRIQAPGADR